MNGIHAAFTGRIGKDAEVRTARDGKPWASFSPWRWTPRPTARPRRLWVRGALFGNTRRHRGPEAHQGHPGLL